MGEGPRQGLGILPRLNMGHRFRKHYSREEAQSLLPQIREWLQQLRRLRQQLSQFDQQLSPLMDQGNDIGGATVNDMIRTLGDTRRTLLQFHCRQIQVKDLDRGLIDFPALIGGREVFLCWEQDEESIEFWHPLDAGYAGRERLSS